MDIKNTLSMNSYGHQGDVPFFPLSKETESKLFKSITLGNPLTPGEDGGITIVEGELTHHHHQFRDPSAVTVQPITFKPKIAGLFDGCKLCLIIVKKPTTFEHFHVKDMKATKEHDLVPVNPGRYLYGTQREMSVTKDVVRVLD
jgi:hypothetical protein